HLPRLWLKVSLQACGKLADGYPDIGQGFDKLTLNDLGLDAEAVRAFISQNKPSYPQFEAWVAQQPDANLSKANIHKHNVAILGYIHDDATRREVLSQDGLPDDGTVLPD